MSILKHIAIRFVLAALLFMLSNWIYSKYFYTQDVQRYSRVKNHIDSAFAEGDVIYMGESSNTSFNPWTDTFTYSISDYLQMYVPGQKIKAITHESYHAGLFRQMFGLMPENPRFKTVILTLNLRTCGPSAVFSANEASNNQEALFYSNRPPLLTRLFLSLKYYDNAPPPERERAKLEYWRTKRIDAQPFSNPYKTVRDWYDHNPFANDSIPEKIRHMADAYIKEFAFILNEKNPRVKDVDAIIRLLSRKKINVILVLLPENRDYADKLFGKKLTQYMDANATFLTNHFSKKELVKVINMYPGPGGENYTDQWFPTEHFNAEIRREIALKLAYQLAKPVNINPAVNNRPNPDIKQPMADTLLRQFGPR